MRSSTLAVIAVSLLVLLAPSAEAGVGSDRAGEPAASVAAKAKKKGKVKKPRCRKGYVLRTVKVKRKGKTVRVKRCRKKAVKKPRKRAAAPTTPTPAPVGPPSPADDAARTLVIAKLANSRFTNCPAGRSADCIVETRYSHFTGGRFAYCRLTPSPTPSPKDRVDSTFEIQNARVEGDGSWGFDSVVPDHGTYRWNVAADGNASGSFRVAGEEQFSDLGPGLQQVAGALDCNS